MSVLADTKEIADSIRVMRVITGALVAGVVSFLAVAVLINWDHQPREGEDNSVLLAIFLVLAALITLAGLLIPRKLLSKQRKELAQSLGEVTRSGNIPVDKLMIMLQGTSIFRLALLEGACFVLLICFVITGKFWLLPVVGAIIGLMVREWPTVAGVTGWIEEQRERFRQDF